MITAIVTALLCGGLTVGAATAGERAIKRAVGKQTRRARRFAGKVEEAVREGEFGEVFPRASSAVEFMSKTFVPCMYGRAPHTPAVTYVDGETHYCSVCRQGIDP